MERTIKRYSDIRIILVIIFLILNFSFLFRLEAHASGNVHVFTACGRWFRSNQYKTFVDNLKKSHIPDYKIDESNFVEYYYDYDAGKKE